MCFSASVSFSASLALIICGIAALKYAREKRLRMIAAIPLIFGLQQFAEGMVWMSFLDPRFAFVRMTSAYIFLACACIIWPLWIPIAAAQFEGARRYKRFVPSIIAGCLCACASFVCAFIYPISVVASCNIVYNLDFSFTQYTVWNHYINMVISLLYVIATIVPFFIARNKMLWAIGALTVASYVISYIAYFEAFTSVWCFFAALISILVYGFVQNQKSKSA